MGREAPKEKMTRRKGGGGHHPQSTRGKAFSGKKSTSSQARRKRTKRKSIKDTTLEGVSVPRGGEKGKIAISGQKKMYVGNEPSGGTR